MPAKPHFSNALFTYLKDLRSHNEREWFKANKGRFESSAKDPAIRFIADFAPKLAKVSPHFRADPRPVGGSLFRIYRDTRFSKDKTPYKTHVGIHFRHEIAKDVHAPGFYLHLEPRQSFLGVGIWHPQPSVAGQIRQAIADDSDRWRRLKKRKAFSAFELAGDSLKRPPRGFDPEHEFVEDLKRKDFIATMSFTQKAVTSPTFLTDFTAACKRAGPFVEFLCDALGVAY